ncbi:MAG: hypothetical protein IH608_11170 [Proteobacteria bacterium]|nr:hypothetical protein [Pseudomonadota bacterium]
MNAYDVLFSLAILVLIGIYGIYWSEARRRSPGRERPGDHPDGAPSGSTGPEQGITRRDAEPSPSVPPSGEGAPRPEAAQESNR